MNKPFGTYEIIEESRDSKIGLFIQTAIYTGMRLSEIRGLKWNRIDLSTGSISVRSAVVSVGGRDVEKEPKTPRSRRLIPLGADHEVIIDLATDKAHKEQQLAQIGQEVLPDHYIFSNNGQKPWSASMIGAHFKVAQKKANVSLTIHEMRHTHMTIALMNGEPVDSVSRRGGHSKTSTTLNIYSHATSGDQTSAINKFTEAMQGKKSPEDLVLSQ